MSKAERREFRKWWWMIALLVALSTIGGYALYVAGIFGERVAFEQSFQYKEARKTEISTFEAQLAEINRQLAGDLDPDTRRNLEAAKAAINVRINAARR